MLKAKRLRNNQTQGQIAEKIGRPQSYIARYEAGQVPLSVVMYMQLVDLLGLTLEDPLLDAQYLVKRCKQAKNLTAARFALLVEKYV